MKGTYPRSVMAASAAIHASTNKLDDHGAHLGCNVSWTAASAAVTL